MARRPLPRGTYGIIRVTQLSKKPPVFEARARFRMADGSVARPRRRGASKTAAEEELKKAMLTLADEVRGADLSKDSRMAHIADLWLAEVERSVRLGDTATGTLRLYRSWTKKWIVPKVGQLTARELEQSVMTCERVIRSAEETGSKTTARGVKAAFRLICGFAVRYGAMVNNPVKSTAQLGADRKQVVALTRGQVRELVAKLDVFALSKQTNKAGVSTGPRGRVWLDLPDRFRAKLATGARVGEIIALDGDSIDPHTRTVTIDHHLVHVAGQGVVRVPGRKGGAPNLKLRYPQWSADMWRRLKLRSGGGPLFPNAGGGWIHPSDASNHESAALEACGFGWVTGHVIRKTVAKALRESGITDDQIAAQLGNSVQVLRAHYLEDYVSNDQQVAALESLFDDVEGTG